MNYSINAAIIFVDLIFYANQTPFIIATYIAKFTIHVSRIERRGKNFMFPYSAKKIKAIKGQFHPIPSEHYLLEIFIFVELVCNYLLFKDNYHTLLNINKVFLTRNISSLAATFYSMNLKLCLEMEVSNA